MKIKVWNPDLTEKETSDIAYFERNMLALLLADIMSNTLLAGEPAGGWYKHEGEGSYEGWSRVISLYAGGMTFHVPDDFDMGHLPEIEPNWDGHTTEEKWEQALLVCGCQID